MKRFGIALAAAALALALVPTTTAATTWTARFTGHGAATLTGPRLALALNAFPAAKPATITLRRGSCSAAGALVLTTRPTASSTGRIARTITLTTVQVRAAKLPLALRVGSRCAAFTAPVAVPGTFGDGTWRVGAAPVLPGTYRTPGTDFCYWARLSGFGGSDIIENGTSKGPAVVTIDAADAGFKSSGCGTWRLNAPAAPTASPGDGTWRVGLDVAPGTYETTIPPGGFCYWARLSGFGGAEIIDNGVGTPGPVIVTISPTDVGFKSSGCGTWTLVP